MARPTRYGRKPALLCATVLFAGPLLAVLEPPSSAAAQHFPPDQEVLLMLTYLVEDGKAGGIVVGFLEADQAEA